MTVTHKGFKNRRHPTVKLPALACDEPYCTFGGDETMAWHRRPSPMIAFVVSVNGKRVGTIGVGDSGVLGAHLSWFMRPDKPGKGKLSLGGLDSNTNEHLDWPARLKPDWPGRLKIKVGDTVTVQVIETEEVDMPTQRRRRER
jgi:hypothetical protein